MEILAWVAFFWAVINHWKIGELKNAADSLNRRVADLERGQAGE